MGGLQLVGHAEVIFYGAFIAPQMGEVALVFEKMEGPTLDRCVMAGEGADGMELRFLGQGGQRFSQKIFPYKLDGPPKPKTIHCSRIRLGEDSFIVLHFILPGGGGNLLDSTNTLKRKAKCAASPRVGEVNTWP